MGRCIEKVSKSPNFPIDSIFVDIGFQFEKLKILLFDIVSIRSTQAQHESEGFYRTKFVRHTGNNSVYLALLVNPEADIPKLDSKTFRKYSADFRTHHPHTGTQVRAEKYDEVTRRGVKILPAEAKRLWEYHHDSSKRTCSHMFWAGKCKNKAMGLECDVSEIVSLSSSLFLLLHFCATSKFEMD